MDEEVVSVVDSEKEVELKQLDSNSSQSFEVFLHRWFQDWKGMFWFE